MSIGPFRDEYRWLSNFWEAPIVYKGITYQTNEHFYQSNKTTHPDEIQSIIDAPTPGKAKRLGNEVTVREDWDAIKFNIMLQATYLKYVQNVALRDLLLSTLDEELIEYNTWHDNFWGVCTCETCDSDMGDNNFGEILMDVRYTISKYLRAEQEYAKSTE